MDSIEYSTIGINDDGATDDVWSMDLVALIVILQFARSGRAYAVGEHGSVWKARRFGLLSVFFIISIVLVHELGHALTFLTHGCEKAHVSVRAAWGFAYCVEMKPEERQDMAVKEDNSANDSSVELRNRWVGTETAGWWIAANGTFAALLYLLLFVFVLYMLHRIIPNMVEKDWPEHFYDFGAYWALVWYPVISVIFRWGDFVAIYAFGEFPVHTGMFCVVQLVFLLCMRWTRKQLQKSGLCKGQGEKQNVEVEVQV
jgi:hypothetical protein